LTIIFFVVADKFRSDLMNIAMTTLSSKILSQDKEYFTELAVDAVIRFKVSKFLSNWCPQALFIDHFVA
jgi:chaperonin GroEL (HSP60 family)